MGDSQLRAAERRTRETGALSDEVAYLQARLRNGDLDREKLRFAARLGHPAALQLVDDLAVGDLIQRSRLSADSPGGWGWRRGPRDREALRVVLETLLRVPLDPLRGEPGAKPGTTTYVRFLLRHVSRSVDREELTDAIRADLLAWALGGDPPGSEV